MNRDRPDADTRTPLVASARGPASRPPPAVAARVGGSTLLAVSALYWLYVTVSNILYAKSLSVGFGAMTTVQLFSPWKVRLLQHIALYPVLAGCLWLSLRIRWKPLWRAIPLQLLLGIGFAVLAAPLLWIGQDLIVGPEALRHMGQETGGAMLSSPVIALWLGSATSFFCSYGFGLALVTGFSWYQRYRDAELRVTALENDWHSARLAALRMQLSPHTLFNLLHTIRGQISWDPRAAQTMVVQLSDLLRRLLSAGERDFSRLADELQFVRLYLELQRQRFPDRLTVVMPDPAGVPAVWVPSLILQPLAENAVVHGLAGHEAPVRIGIDAVVVGDTLTLRVTNTVSPSRVINREGIGLSNLRERLAVQFGPRAHLQAGLETPDRWLAEAQLPALHEAPPGRPGHVAAERAA